MYSYSFLFAQQDPQFSQNTFLKLPVNPAYAGMSGSVCATGAYRTQWVGFTGAPRTFLFTVDAPVLALHGGAGLTVMSDNLGNFGFLHAKLDYSYHMVIGQTGLLGLGIEAGMMQASVKYDWLAPDGSNGASDGAIPNSAVKKATYDVGFGVYYKTNQLYVGVSVAHLPGKMEKFVATDFKYEQARHYYIMAGYDFNLTSSLTLRPSVHIKSDAVVNIFDANALLLWNNMVWGGVSYRWNDAIVPMVGFAWSPDSKSTLRIGYSYDLGTSSLKPYHKNTHEILVNYCIKIIPKPKIQSHQNPRFLK